MTYVTNHPVYIKRFNFTLFTFPILLSLANPAVADNAFIALGTLGGNYSTVTAMSPDGSSVVGYSYTAGNGFMHAYRWLNNSMLDLSGAQNTEDSFAYAISADGGAVAGYSSAQVTNPVAFRWGNGKLDYLPGYMGYATAISADGVVVVGQSADSNNVQYAVRWENGIATFLPDLGLGSGTTAISADKNIIAGGVITPYGTHAARWVNGNMTDLGSLGGDSVANAMSTDGSTIVGYSSLKDNVYPRATRSVNGSSMYYLGSLGGDSDSAQAVSADGTIVTGYSYTMGDAVYHAFRWVNGSMSDLGTLGGANSYAYAISADGSAIVGSSDISNSSSAFRWTQATGMQRITSWLTNAGVIIPAGWVLTTAVAVSQDGTIVAGYGIPPGGGQQAWLARVNATLNPKNLGGCHNKLIPGVNFVGNPINAGVGNKFQQEVDRFGVHLNFIRYYNNKLVGNIEIGAGWRTNYDQTLVHSAASASTVTLIRPDGKSFDFVMSGTQWMPSDNDIKDTLTQIIDGTGATTGWRYTVADDDTVETYDASGKLLSIIDRDGQTQTLAYDTYSHLISVTDDMGRQLSFTYDANSRIATMTDQSGSVYQYVYDANNNLSSITYPDNTVKTYLYENPSFPNALTGIIDENGARYATYGYDSQGRGNLSTHALGDGQVNLAYNSDGSTTVTDAIGTVRTYTFQTILGVVKNSGLTQPCATCGGSGAAVTSYDANGNVASRTDFNGVVTTYTYDLTRNLETSRTEAAGTAQARTITTVWDANFRLPDSITEPGKVTRYTYDSHGNVTQYSVQDTATGTTRSWNTSYTYASTVPGAILSKVVDGPRTDVTDITTTNYYDPAATCSGTAPLGCRGQISSVTNALNQTTSITQYDANSQPLSLTDPNGLTTTLSYDLRQRLTSLTQGNLTTQYNYDPAGNLTQVSTPSGQTIHYTYDAAHRLTDIQDGQGNRIHYTLDAMGNRTREDLYDPNGVNVATHSRSFDALNRLYQDIGAVNQTTTYQYDANGNLTTATDALNHNTSYQYDALNRVIQATDPNLGKTALTYNPLDQLTQVTDPRALNTSYGKDAFGDTTSIASPDTGTTSYSYDTAGNLTSKVDAKNQTTSYQYDALNRLTNITYQDATQAHYTWDQGSNGIGRLGQLQDSSGTTSYQYDQYGHLTSKTQGVDTLQYAYDPATGQLTQLTYPNGQTISYSYTQGRISSLTVNTTPLLSNIQYQPFGAAKSWTWGNGLAYSRSFNSDGLLSSYPLYTTVKTLSYDPAGRITGISDPANPQTLTYDALNRLTSYATPSANQSYQYDANGNRTQLMVGATSYPYSISSTSNRLNSVTGPTAQTNSYDATGNLTSDGTRTYSYDARGRLSQTIVPTGRLDRRSLTTTYSLNAFGQRVAKPSAGIRYVYDEAGHLVYETNGSSSTAYVYLDDTPVAVLH